MATARITEQHIAYIKTLERPGGILIPNDVLANAKQPTSPIHELYDWDKDRAAEQHWLDRTREIIRWYSLVIHREEREVVFPAWVRDPSRHPREQGYINTVEALAVDPTLSRRALVTALQQVSSALKRARDLAVALGREDEVAAILEQVAGLRSSVSRVVEAEIVNNDGENGGQSEGRRPRSL